MHLPCEKIYEDILNTQGKFLPRGYDQELWSSDFVDFLSKNTFWSIVKMAKMNTLGE